MRGLLSLGGGMAGLLAAGIRQPADEIDEAFLRRYAQQGFEGQPTVAVRAPVPASASPQPRQRERVSAMRVLDRVLGGQTITGGLDAERARLEADARRPEREALIARLGEISRQMGPQAEIAFALNPEKFGESVAEQFAPQVVSAGAAQFVGGRRVGEQPTYTETGDTTIERTSAGVRPVFTRADPSITEQISADKNTVDRERLAFDQSNAGFELSQGQTRFNPDGTPVAAVAPAPRNQGLSRFEEGQVEKYYQELSALENIDAELGRFDTMIANGDLELGPVANAVGGARNAIGMSSGNSRNLAEFRSTLERIRNDSLRLNNGVQTEGDSQRAWNELVTNINDPAVVRRQLQRIKTINAQARQFRQQRLSALEGQSGGGTALPAIGAVEDGYEYIGGDPGSPSSWQPAN